MKVTFLCNSLINRTLAFQSSYVFGRTVESLSFPKENHSEKEIFPTGCEKIRVSDDTDKIIAESDYVFISNENQHFPGTGDSTADNIVKIRNPWGESFEADKSAVETDFTEKIKIIILSVGVFTDIYYTETAVNKILSELGVKTHQIFSTETKCILSDLEKHNLLNPNLLSCSDTDAEIAVVSIDAANYASDADLISELCHISPNLIFISIDNSIESVDDICKISEIAGNIAAVIRSPYISYDVGTGVKYPVYSGKRTDDSCISSIDPNFEAIIKKALANSLYFPSEIVLL